MAIIIIIINIKCDFNKIWFAFMFLLWTHNKSSFPDLWDRWEDSFGNDKIIQPPPHILCSRPAQVRPERVRLLCLWVVVPKHIHKARLQHAGEVVTLSIKEPCRFVTVWFGVSQVNPKVRHVEIPAPYHRFLLVEFIDVFKEFTIPFIS